jgi:hypothetical protein
MGVATKNRRKIDVDGRCYLWYVADDHHDFPLTVGEGELLLALNILSDDKRFVARFHLGQGKAAGRHITIIGREFVGVDSSGTWRRFLCPNWCVQRAITPVDVRAIIEWCNDTHAKRFMVDCKGSLMEGQETKPGYQDVKE